jgi:hypothetical protein
MGLKQQQRCSDVPKISFCGERKVILKACISRAFNFGECKSGDLGGGGVT